jgi:hypothetical protein
VRATQRWQRQLPLASLPISTLNGKCGSAGLRCGLWGHPKQRKLPCQEQEVEQRRADGQPAAREGPGAHASDGTAPKRRRSLAQAHASPEPLLAHRQPHQRHALQRLGPQQLHLLACGNGRVWDRLVRVGALVVCKWGKWHVWGGEGALVGGRAGHMGAAGAREAQPPTKGPRAGGWLPGWLACARGAPHAAV